MTGRINFTPEAERHLNEIDDWITNAASADIARSFVSAILDHIDGIMDEDHDQAGAEAKDGTGGIDQTHPLQLRPHGPSRCRQGKGSSAGSDGGDHPPRIAKSEGKTKISTPEQVGAALLEAPDHFHAFAAVCAFAGLRLGEAAGIQLGDLDFLRRTMSIQRQIQGQVNSKTVEVSPKYESARRVYLPDDLVKVLAAHVEKHPPMGRSGGCSRSTATCTTETAPGTSGGNCGRKWAWKRSPCTICGTTSRPA